MTELILEILGLAADTAKVTIKKLVKFLLIIVATGLLCCLFYVVGYLGNSELLMRLSVGALCLVILLFGCSLIIINTILKMPFRKENSFGQGINATLNLGIWIISISLIFFFAPILDAPWAPFALLLIGLLFGLIFARFSVNIGPTFYIVRTIAILLIVITFMYFPAMHEWLVEARESSNQVLKGDAIARFNTPKLIHYDIHDFRNLTFFKTIKNGKKEAVIWWYQRHDEKPELFNRSGIHPLRGQELRTITPEDVDYIERWLKEHESPTTTTSSTTSTSTSTTAETIAESETAITIYQEPEITIVITTTTVTTTTTSLYSYRPPPSPEITIAKRVFILEEGKLISVRLLDGLDSNANGAGDIFTAELAFDLISSDNDVVIGRGSLVVGEVRESVRADKIKGRARMVLALTMIQRAGWPVVAITTQPLTIEADPSIKRDVGRAVITTGIGAVIGALAGGKQGAGIGASAGAGTGVATALLTRGKAVKLATETQLDFRLAQSVVITR